MEFADFVILTHICLHHTGCIDIFLYRVVQYVIFVKHLDEMRMSRLRNKNQDTAKDRDGDQQHERNLCVDRKCHDQRKHDHDRCPRQQTDCHHVCHLNVGNIRRQPCHQTGRGKLINVLE